MSIKESGRLVVQKMVAAAGSSDENLKIFHAIAQVFQKAQLTYAGHRKHVAVLKRIQSKAIEQGYEEAFNYWLNKLVTRVLPLKKNEAVGDRIVKLVAAFIASLDRDAEAAKGQSGSTNEEISARFIDQFMRHLLRGMESKDRNVRFRVLQLMAFIMDNIGEIDEELYNLLMWSLRKRIYDKESHVRMQAVFCLTKFQEEEEEEEEEKVKDELDDATSELMRMIQNDPSAEVRRAVLLNLVNNSMTRAHILERARDVNQVNRRLVYSRVLRSMGLKSFDEVDFRILDQLIKWGLEDREEPVRRACIKLISHDWLNWLNGDLIEFLEKLNVMESTVAAKTLDALFKARKDVIPKIKFPESVWRDFNVETAFLLQCFYTYCLDNNFTEVLESNFPEASKLSEYLDYYLKKRFDQQEEQRDLSTDDAKHLEFILEQLLITANRYDFSDEIGRRSMLTVVRNMLGVVELSKPLIKIGLEVLKSLSINEKDFITMAIEIINDIRDEDIDKQELEEGKGQEIENEDENLEAFHLAVNNLVENGGSIDEDGTSSLHREREASAQTIFVCLSRSSCMLELVEMPLEQNILITSVIDTLITPAVRNTEPKIRELGVKNLALCCLLDVQLATESMYIFGMCVSKGNATLKSIALKSIMDIFSVHGTTVVDGESKVDSISLHKIFYRVLKNNELPECQVIAAEGLCKLYLADIFTDDDLFETLVLSYFTPINANNEALIQAFAFCLPVYCFSHRNHQQRIARVAGDILLRLCVSWDEIQNSGEADDLKDAMLKPNVIFQQLIDWTDPRKLINRSENEAKKDDVQLNFLLDFLELFGKIENKNVKKLLLNNINAFYISAAYGLDKLKVVLENIEDITENNTLDNVILNSLERFKTTLKGAIEEAMELSLKQESATNSDLEYSMILENSFISNSQQEQEHEQKNLDGKDGEEGDKQSSVENGSREDSSIDNSRGRKRKRVDVIKEASKPVVSESSRNISFALPDAAVEGDDAMSVDDSSYSADS